jgi:hypothetical protein
LLLSGSNPIARKRSGNVELVKFGNGCGETVKTECICTPAKPNLAGVPFEILYRKSLRESVGAVKKHDSRRLE